MKKVKIFTLLFLFMLFLSSTYSQTGLKFDQLVAGDNFFESQKRENDYFKPNPNINSVKDNYFDLIQSNANGDVIGGERFLFDNKITNSIYKRNSVDSSYKPLFYINRQYYNIREDSTSKMFTFLDLENIIDSSIYDFVAYYYLSQTNSDSRYLGKAIFREDRINKIITILDPTKGNDNRLFYNFNWKQNDTVDIYVNKSFHLFNHQPSNKISKAKIDSVKYETYFNIKENKEELLKSHYWHSLDSNMVFGKFINGIGMDKGLSFFYNFYQKSIDSLICISENDNKSLIYQLNNNYNCVDYISAISYNKHPELSIYPNPSSLSTLITLPQDGGTLTVIDALGRMVYIDAKISQGTYELNTSTYTPGIYQLRYTYAGGTAVGKVMVQR